MRVKITGKKKRRCPQRNTSFETTRLARARGKGLPLAGRQGIENSSRARFKHVRLRFVSFSGQLFGRPRLFCPADNDIHNILSMCCPDDDGSDLRSTWMWRQPHYIIGSRLVPLSRNPSFSLFWGVGEKYAKKNHKKLNVAVMEREERKKGGEGRQWVTKVTPLGKSFGATRPPALPLAEALSQNLRGRRKRKKKRKLFNGKQHDISLYIH
ncbi:hypothetical protein QBC47DRAFT_367304 [Echria macrotheca]|uniref:Uncharacterized protein n=1 Tax=Echria macrotheca TaxID=438768 RepID=A0AAJ0BM65_9PEZI|nr:hypothetical protein QBC47DRAFT_367304 [Echria macrotheca]